MKLNPKTPKGFQVCLAVWPDKSAPCSQMGDEHALGAMLESSGAITLQLRLYNDADRTIHSIWEHRDLSEAVRRICPRIHISREPGYCSVNLCGHDIYYAEVSDLECVVAAMKLWEKQSETLRLGGTESLDTQVRRTFAGIGVKNAVLISGRGNSYETMPLEMALHHYLTPAIETIRGRLPKRDAA